MSDITLRFWLLLVVCLVDVTPATNPGLKVRLSQPGLQYAASVAVQIVSGKVRGMSLPDLSGSKRIPAGKVEYQVQDMKVTSFQQPATSVTVNPGRGLTWSLTNAAISVHGNWRYTLRMAFVKVRDHGSFDASVSGVSVTVSATLGTSATGQPTIAATGCRADIGRLKIRLHGGASWLYNLFVGSVEKPVRNNLERQICDRAKTAINEDVARELSTLRVSVVIAKRWLLDYRLVSGPGFGDGYVETAHKGELFAVGDPTEAPFQPAPMPPPPPTANRMVTFSVSSYVANTMGYALHKHGELDTKIGKNDLPPAYRNMLDTTCEGLKCIGKLIPAIGRLYPNTSVDVDLRTTAAPTVDVDAKSVVGNFDETVRLSARLSNGSSAHLLDLRVVVRAAVAPRLDGAVVKAAIDSLNETLSVTSTSIGPVSEFVLRMAFDVAMKTHVVPKLNEIGARGFPLPSVAHAQFVNVGLQLLPGCLSISTDVRYSRSTNALLYDGIANGGEANVGNVL